MSDHGVNDRHRAAVPEQVRLALGTSPLAVVLVAADGTLQWANRKLTEQTGYRRRDVVGNKVALLRCDRHELSFYRRLWVELCRHGGWEGEIWSRRAAGGSYPARLVATRFPADASGARYIGYLEDLTRAKSMEAELRRQLVEAQEAAEAAARARSRFLARMSHELRTPLNGVLGMSEMLLGADLPAESIERIRTIRLCGEALLATIGGTPREVEKRPTLPALRPARSLRVLVAEDNAVNQTVVDLMLRSLGHMVETVEDGRAAVEAVRARAFDVVLMDVQMPAMDGLEATRRIRESLPPESTPRIVGLSAHAGPESRKACLDAGMDAYLTKPLDLERLHAVLEEQSADFPARGSSRASEPGA